MLAVVGVAAIALGTGFLNNDIELWIQQFGVGSGDISTPTDHITVDFNIAQNQDPVTELWDNVIDKCILTPEDTIGQTEGDTNPENGDTTKRSSLTCKLTGKEACPPPNENTWCGSGDVLTEGKVCAFVFLQGVPVMVPMGFTCDERILSGPGTAPTPLNGASESEDVKDVGDVIVVAHGNTYSMGD